MKTKITTSVLEAARFILKGELVAFPTETVYGLGANVFEEEAIRKIFAVKGRPADNPLIVHIAHFSELGILAKRITKYAEKFIEHFFPGPLTVILPRSKFVPKVVSAGLDTVAVRMPAHQVAHRFLEACGVSIAAPSANLSGKPSPTTWQAVKADLGGKISCILKDEQSQIGLESTVVDCTGNTPLVMRLGAVTLEDLQVVVPETKLYKPKNLKAPKSPGMKYRHYAPDAPLTIITSPAEIASPNSTAAYIGLDALPKGIEVAKKKICTSLQEYAHSLYRFLRECDQRGIERIYCQAVPEQGIGLAIMDRLRKAATPDSSTHH
ncbi:MAG: L-threonylcarbamoyladenylate synthase [Chloroherpetonaceae bacterium]|nr:L-threonylcarbamoyladenylate synthase [Chloroherpetonaceae bacterium]MDW8467484.1 L-threonylcarbamoyladenylate synthase [Chloroherpetonaceae bacterium]